MQHEEALSLPRAADNDDGAREAVEVVARVRGAQTVVQVRGLRSRAVLLSIGAVDDAGAAFAALCAERFCAERGLVLVMRPRRAA